jgi:iron complex outermembrane receptor protein
VLRYVSDRVSGWDAGSQPQYDLPSYTTVDIRGSVAFGHATARLFVRNLFDERGQLSADTLTVVPFGGPVQVSIMQPRTIGMSVDVNF